MTDESTGGMYRFLLCWEGDGETYYYAGGYQTGAERSGEGDLIGVCLTPKGQRPSGASTLTEFEENVDEVAIDTRWFDEPLARGDE